MNYDYGFVGEDNDDSFVGASPEEMLQQIVAGHEIIGYDLIGDDEIVGDDELIGEEIIGARRVRRPAGGTRVVKTQPNQRRRLITGVPPLVLLSATQGDSQTQPQDLFRVERVTVPSNIAFDFVFIDIKIGQKSQLVASGQLPCGAFTEVAVDNYVQFDTASIGNLITLSVLNVTSPAATQTFRAVLVGTAAV